MILNSGFFGKAANRANSDRLPPGQYLTDDFPVLSVGVTPHIEAEEATLEFTGLCKNKKYTFEELSSLNTHEFTTDIHCVTKWSKFDTRWEGVWLEDLVEELDSNAKFILAYSYDNYTTNLPISDVLGKKCLVAWRYEGEPIAAVHGGPIRLVIPHLYFWKSAKWVNKIEFLSEEVQGFWEVNGYHNYGDPWKEERYG